MTAAAIKKNNFDLVRFSLAIIVFFYHVSVLTQLPELTGLGIYLSAEFAVDAFFVVSGFLIFMSYENSPSIKSYFLKRLRRVAPAYIAVILICSIAFFCISSFDFNHYFSFAWLKYIVMNMVTLNFLQHSLPGVFEENFMSAVNGALWTIKVEVMFYFSVPIVIFLFTKVNKWLVMTSIYVIATIYSLTMVYLEQKTGNGLYLILERQLPGQMSFFISGAFLYYGFDRFSKHSTLIFVVGVLVFTASKAMGLYFFYPASLAVMVIYGALIFKYVGNWGRFGDFSFGIYIWHFPLTQLFIQLGYFDSNPFLALAALVLSVMFAAYLSWHFIEKKFLNQNSHYRKVETL